MPNTAERAADWTPQDPGRAPQAAPRAPGPSDGGTLNGAFGHAGAMASPAARLQATLDAEFAIADEAERWPLRWTVAMVFLTCGAFWTAVYFVVAALIG